jgi:uncharacterized protein YukE
MAIQALLRFARQIVQSVLGQLTQQLNVVEEMALSPMKMMVQQVTGGVWKGKGANAFVEEVSSLMIPGVGTVGQHIRMVSTNLKRASDIIDRADEQVNSLSKAIGDQFGSIY